jgi:hypothetical protein
MFKSLFCLLASIIVNTTIFAQNVRGQLVWSPKEVKMLTINEKEINKFSTIHVFPQQVALQTTQYLKKIQPQFIAPQSIRHTNFPKTTAVIPRDFYNLNIGWVCKQEWKLEKKTTIPIRLRLGSTEQVDYLEGKKKHSD